MIYNMVGGGAGSAGGGATLVVSAPANVSVTVSKDDKSYTKSSGSLGSATFKGLATGIWTVVISNNGQTATRTIEITADYAITLAFFSATINITYPASSTCVVKNASGQTIASDTNTTSSEKTWTATVGATGTYTVTATATDGSGDTDSRNVNISTDGETVSVSLTYTTYLLKDGVFSTLVGGFTKLEADVAFTDGQIVGTGAGGTSGCGFYLTNSFTVNTTEDNQYSTLIVHAKMTELSSGYPAKVGLHTSKMNKQDYSIQKNLFTASITMSKATDFTTYTTDISALSGTYYFNGCGVANFVIDEIGLE